MEAEVIEKDGKWYVTLAKGPNGASEGMSYEKRENETIEDVKKRIPEIMRDYTNIGKYGH